MIYHGEGQISFAKHPFLQFHYKAKYLFFLCLKILMTKIENISKCLDINKSLISTKVRVFPVQISTNFKPNFFLPLYNIT